MPAVNQVVLALGSNLGNRASHLQLALDALVDSGILANIGASRIYETEPVGGPEQGPYLNAVIHGSTELHPQELLNQIHRIESELGRVRTVRWGARTIDIDILAYGNGVYESPDLVIPHPRAYERAFVLLPWSEFGANYEIPNRGTVGECLAVLSVEGIEIDEVNSLHLGSKDNV